MKPQPFARLHTLLVTLFAECRYCIRCALSILHHRRAAYSQEQAEQILAGYSPCPAGSAVLQPDRRHDLSRTDLHDLQIIIPAYNVQTYLDACMESVLAQRSEYSFCVTLVDDGSSDDTPAISDRYADYPGVQVIHRANGGLSEARNEGLRRLRGRYIYFLDSDDLLCPGAVDALMRAAYETDADIIQGGHQRLVDDKILPGRSYPACEIVSSRDTLTGFMCGKAIRSALFETIQCPPGYWFEDSIMKLLIAPLAGTLAVIPEIVFTYRILQSGITMSAAVRPKCIDTFYVLRQTLRDRDALGIPADALLYKQIMRYVRLNYRRIAQTPDEIQESVFVLTCALARQYCPTCEREDRLLHKALMRGDYGLYKYCLRVFPQ